MFEKIGIDCTDFYKKKIFGSDNHIEQSYYSLCYKYHKLMNKERCGISDCFCNNKGKFLLTNN